MFGVSLQDESFHWLVSLVSLVDWIEVEAPLHSSAANFELNSDSFWWSVLLVQDVNLILTIILTVLFDSTGEKINVCPLLCSLTN
jgi:hypothetical protein